MLRGTADRSGTTMGVCRTGSLVATMLLLLVTLVPVPGLAGTIVRVSTSIGDFSVELFDDIAPVTVGNFLGYVERNDFNGTYLHRVVSDFVMQGGGYRFEPFVGAVDVPTEPPIPNEFSLSNVRGTIAMAKLDGQPDSATSQWFVNITDNTELDTSTGGFTVFGEVMGEGMTIVDAIDDLPTINLGSKASDAPYFTPSYNDPEDFVTINVEVTRRFSSAPHVFETETGLLITTVDVDNGEQLISLNFNAVPGTGDLVIQANLESLIRRRDAFPEIATYATSDGTLRIPVLEVNDAGNVFLVDNVVFVRSAADPSQFVLDSFDQR